MERFMEEQANLLELEKKTQQESSNKAKEGTAY